MATGELTEASSAPSNQPQPSAANPAPQTSDDAYVEIQPSGWRSALHNCGAFAFSTIFHLILLIVAGMTFLAPQLQENMRTIISSLSEPEIEDPPVEVELEQDLEAMTEQTLAVFSAAPAAAMLGTLQGESSRPQLDQKLVNKLNSPEMRIAPASLGLPTMIRAVEAVPDGTLGDPRQIVDSYQDAMDRITQELIWMLEKGDVLVIWCFDQSESMKDDQQEIRDRINKVYSELGLSDRASGDHLLTAITSYGGSFNVHTRRPTSDRIAIRDAIDAVPIDPSGREKMCEAVGTSIAAHRQFARNRQMALILVTDESGERPNNEAYLERAIAEARDAKCTIYTLGREAVFGYPYAYIRWRHPQTQRIHWLRVDRGPETAYVEQLQTNGFRYRHDSFSSGFGPYEQTRMARETNGIFFMLPTVEANLVRGNEDKRRYELEAMRPFRPDLSSREELYRARNDHPLRTLIWKVVNDLNPHVNKEVTLRMTFSIKPPEFRKQMGQEVTRVPVLLRYMAAAQKALEQGRELREQEADPRWQANYDLMYAQIIAYQARIHEYRVALVDFVKKPKTAPLRKSATQVLHHWDIRTQKQIRSEDSKPYIDKSAKLLDQVARDFSGTPWAERARWERRRGFGVELRPDYDRPWIQVKNPKPPPKL